MKDVSMWSEKIGRNFQTRKSFCSILQSIQIVNRLLVKVYEEAKSQF